MFVKYTYIFSVSRLFALSIHLVEAQVMVTQPPATPQHNVDVRSHQPMEADGDQGGGGGMFKSQLALQPLESDMLALNIRPVGPDSKYNIHEIPSVDGKR